MLLQTDGSGVEVGLYLCMCMCVCVSVGVVGEGGVLRAAIHLSMLRNAYAQWPLDGTSETGSVLLRLLKDGLIGAVSITL